MKILKLGMVSSFHPHSMCERVERVTAKTGRTSCTNWTISFGVSGFLTRTHLLHGHFILVRKFRYMRFDDLIKILLYIATLYILVRKLIELVYF